MRYTKLKQTKKGKEKNTDSDYSEIYFTVMKEHTTSKIKCWTFRNVKYKANNV